MIRLVSDCTKMSETMFLYESFNCEVGDEIHLYGVLTTNLLFVRRGHLR